MITTCNFTADFSIYSACLEAGYEVHKYQSCNQGTLLAINVRIGCKTFFSKCNFEQLLNKEVGKRGLPICTVHTIKPRCMLSILRLLSEKHFLKIIHFPCFTERLRSLGIDILFLPKTIKTF